jgi:hypothetical protein
VWDEFAALVRALENDDPAAVRVYRRLIRELADRW